LGRLTRREHEVLTLLVDGRRRHEIAHLLCITPKTVSTHIERILGKLGAHSQAQAVAFALRQGVVRIETLPA
jgi:DNA-binding NarL/FixJ family response regulator